MAERTYDKLLSIKTVGIREWRDKSVSFNRYEATPIRLWTYFSSHTK